jgi:ATP-dependent Lhr-like helicase
LRAEIEPVAANEFMRFLFSWQHVPAKLMGPDGLRAVIAQLDGYEISATAWERHVLPQRIDRYEPSMLDMLCLTGEVSWARLTTGVALFPRANGKSWLGEIPAPELSEAAQRALELLQSRGASFTQDLGDRNALNELVNAGLITSDGFAGRSEAGRWSIIPRGEQDIEAQARALLLRYGVVFRRLVAREPNTAPWRELARVYRRLEARGEIRGGRFVTGMSGEQFALGEAVDRLREVRREGGDGKLVVISAADPLNLTGIITSSERVRAIPSNRIAYRDGVAVSTMEGDCLRPLADIEPSQAMEVAAALAGRRVPVASGFVGRTA